MKYLQNVQNYLSTNYSKKFVYLKVYEIAYKCQKLLVWLGIENTIQHVLIWHTRYQLFEKVEIYKMSYSERIYCKKMFKIQSSTR